MRSDGRTDGITRRQALKRAAAAGAVVWATPVVQTLNMQRAWAVSPLPTCYSVKLQPGSCESFNGNNAGAFTCYQPGDTLQVGDGCAQASVSVNNDGTWTALLKPGCYFDFGYTHGGPGALACGKNPTPSGTTDAIVFYPNGPHSISNLQLNVCCLPLGT